MSDIKVSVIMPVYNQKQDYLQQAVDSVFKQTYKNWELIIIDDGSDDPIIMKDMPSNVKLIRKENGGVASALNIGIKEARGEWIAWLSSDDKWYEDKLERQLSYSKKHPEAKVIYSDWEYIDETGKQIVTTIEPYYDKIEDLQFRLCHKFFGCGSATIIHRSCFDDVGLFDESLKAAEDHEMWGRLSSKFMFYKVHMVLMQYRTHQGALRFIPNAMEWCNNARAKVRTILKYKPEVSVVVIGHNVEKTISKCLVTISRTPNVNEIIFVNDNSTDDTKIIAEGLNSILPLINIINLPMQLGRGKARNTGLKLAKNHLVCSVDGDVIPNEGWLDMLIQKMDEFWLDSSALSVEWDCPNMGFWAPTVTYYQNVTSKKSIGTVMTLWSKDMLQQLTYLDDTMSSGEDSDFFMRAQKLNYRFMKFHDVGGIHYEYRNFPEWLTRHFEYGKDRAVLYNKHKDIMMGQINSAELENNPREMMTIIENAASVIGTCGFRDKWNEIGGGR